MGSPGGQLVAGDLPARQARAEGRPVVRPRDGDERPTRPASAGCALSVARVRVTPSEWATTSTRGALV